MEQVEIDELIWDYIDGRGDAIYLQSIEARIKTNKQWTLRCAELKQLSLQLNDLPTQQPSLRFAQNVMDKLEALPTPVSAQSYINMRVVKAIAAAFVLIIAGALCYAILSTNWSPTDWFLSSDSAPITITTSTAIHVILILNILLALLFFEKISARLFRHQRP